MKSMFSNIKSNFTRKKAILIGLIAAAVVIAAVIIVANKPEKINDNARVSRSRLPMFSASSPVVIPLGISAAEARALSSGEQLLESHVEITGPRGERINHEIEMSITQQENDQYAIAITQKKSSQFRPGKYHLQAEINTAHGIRRIEQDFLWGVLAVNPNKSIYRPGETAKLALAVLDERGNMVCNAKVALQIQNLPPQRDPAYLRELESRGGTKSKIQNLGTEDGRIRVNDECRQKRVTSRPDYEAEYVVGGPGVYQMTLTATTKNGTYTIEDYFEVKESVPFDIERMTATRIYPVHEYPVTIRITPEKDFQGTVEERVPASFAVQETRDKAHISYKSYKIYTTDRGGKAIAWDVDWRAGQAYELSYVYKSPVISPQFYMLGPLRLVPTEVGTRSGQAYFEEARRWQIAVDAEATIDASTTGTDLRGKNKPVMVFISDQIGYMFYVDGNNATYVYSKTTNGGVSWGVAVAVCSGTSCNGAAIWYDRWTPGDDTGNYIHMVFEDADADDIIYDRLNTADDSQLGDTIVFDFAASINQSDNIAITKATGGVLYIGLSDANNSPGSHVKKCSATCGTAGNWVASEATSPLEQVNDYIRLLPLASGDVLLIRDDVSADDIQSKVYTSASSAWSVSWTNIDTTAVESLVYQESIAATVKRSDNTIYLTYGADVAGASIADIRTAVYSGGSWTSKTNVVTDRNTMLNFDIAIDENTGDLYVAYLEGTAVTAMTAYYKKSTDGMTSWGAATQFNTTGGDLFWVYTNMMSNERIYGAYRVDVVYDLLGDTIADLTTNSAPTITSASDTPDPTNPSRSVTFITDWNDADSGETVKVKICKTNSLTSQICGGGSWASSTAFTTLDPESVAYDVVGGDAGQTRDYWAFVCDDGASCSAGTAGTFSVNTVSSVPNVKFR
ncbi:MAG: hypothetical protein WC749_03070 [Dehalococcoidia bacterium]